MIIICGLTNVFTLPYYSSIKITINFGFMIHYNVYHNVYFKQVILTKVKYILINRLTTGISDTNKILLNIAKYVYDYAKHTCI